MQPSNKVLVAQNNILDRIAAVRRGEEREGGKGRQGRGVCLSRKLIFNELMLSYG